jgi:small-conductance mechanosensitive channel
VLEKLIQSCTDQAWIALLIRLGIIAFLTVIIYIVAGWILNILERFAREKTTWEFDEKLIAYLKTPIKRLILVIGAFYFLDCFTRHLGATYEKYLNGVFYILIVFQVAFSLMGLVAKGAKLYSSQLIERKVIAGKEEFVPLLVRVGKIIIFFIALIIVLKHFNQDVQSLVVSLGVGSLAIALAAQETLANMIAGFVIMTDRPFRVGDRIQLSSGEQGDVYEIGLRSTRVLTFDNTLIVVPNAQIVKEKVHNLTYPDPATRVKVKVAVAYGSDIDRIKMILVEVCSRHPKVLSDPPPQAYLLDLGDSALEFMVTCRVPDWREEWTVSEEIRIEIYRRFREERIEIPFPQRTVWIEDKGHKR